ncbi:uncharacterized protein TNCV_3930491 [Trichonephila clavipes]|nr:uncharacterized protein TNCV_3930491 [Trichonephila clavipes]
MVIQPPRRHIDLHTIPQDGYEFIHRARLEDDDDLENSSLLSKMKALELVAKEKARDFSLFAEKLQMKKTILQQKFPRNREDFYPKSDEVEWCRFLLGSKLCSKIYRTRDTGVQGHLPLLSLILYFSQDEIQMLIEYIYQWFLEIGMEEAMCMWLYALFACLEKPVDDNFQQVLEKFHFECKRFQPRTSLADPTVTICDHSPRTSERRNVRGGKDRSHMVPGLASKVDALTLGCCVWPGIS